MSHAVQRRLIHFEEVGANLCAAGLTSRRVIRVSSLHGTVLFLVTKAGCGVRSLILLASDSWSSRGVMHLLLLMA